MRYILLSFVFTAICTTLMATVLPAPAFSVMLSAGTPVEVNLNESLDLDLATRGQAVDFIVRHDVVVNGKVLIAAGAWATGVIQKVKMACDGNCGTITLTMTEARAVDGTVVRLRSMPRTFQNEVQTGATLRALVLDDIWINA